MSVDLNHLLNTLPLLPQHVADLARSGISESQARDAGIRSVSNPATIAAILNWDRPAKTLGPCMLFTFRDECGKLIDDYARLKPDKPRVRKKHDGAKESIKYESPISGSNRAYFPPGVSLSLHDPSIPLLITEGEKKSLKAMLAGFPTIGLVGVEGWSIRREVDPATGKKVGERKLIPTLDAVTWQGRRVIIVFDSDAKRKPDVQRAELALGKALAAQGADVYVLRLPDTETVGPCDPIKQGLDDYLVVEGAEKLATILDKSAKPLKDMESAAQAAKSQREQCNQKFFQNFVIEKDENGKPKRVGLSAFTIQKRLSDKSDDWPRRVGSSLFVPDGDCGPLWLAKPVDLFAWIGKIFCNDSTESCVEWAATSDAVSRYEFDAFLRQNATRYEAVESAPHEPPIKNHFYIHPPLEGGDGRALDALLNRFNAETPEDAQLIASFFVTLAWGGPAGQRPAFLFTSSDDDKEGGRGIGKTTLVRIAGKLFGGTFDIRQGDDWSDVTKRLLSSNDTSTQRIILIDNVKTHRFSWADVEALITSERINGRKMYVGDASRPNHFTVCITLNGASMSKDMAQRSIIVKLKRPTHAGDWESKTAALIEQKRQAILGDLVAHLKCPAIELDSLSRWGAWESAVIARLPDPGALQKLIRERSADVDDDQSEGNLIREAIASILRDRGHGNPNEALVRIPCPAMVEIVNKALNERLTATAVGTKLKVLCGSIPELKKVKSNNNRHWQWAGKDCVSTLAEDLRGTGGTGLLNSELRLGV